jgi:C4-dicarboxylate-specific signal transduction histidine kinase
MNILNNAKDSLKKQKENRHILIEIDEDNEGKSRLRVTDSGEGIGPDILERVFEAHFTTKPRDEGTGIGLYMSQVIIEKHMHGKIMAANTKDGGARFTITL